MIFSNLDTIVRRWLLERNLPIHYYFEGLLHASTSIQELSFDTLKIINSANLPVGQYGQVNLPDDFQDDIGVCISIAGALAPLPKQEWITPIRVHSTNTGQFVPNTLVPTDISGGDFLGFNNWWGLWYWNISDYGEPQGKYFGANGGSDMGYKVIKERRQIQMTDNFIGSNITLLYISDGQSIDNATQVDNYAISCIKSYIDWKRSPNRDIKDSREAATYYNERRLLRARLNDMTLVDLVNTFRNSYTATIKK